MSVRKRMQITAGWLARWLEKFSQSEKLEPLQQPKGLEGQLRPYQLYGYSWLAFLRKWGMGACLADDMGLGKTIQTISLLLHEKGTNARLPGPVLLIAPTSVVTNWRREITRFAPKLRTYAVFMPLDSGFETRGCTLTLRDNILHITTVTRFTDNSGRKDFTSEDDFGKSDILP